MLTPYSITTPRNTEEISTFFAELRLIKELFEERYMLDHFMNVDDTDDIDGHNRLVMYGIEVDMYAEDQPYVMNYRTGITQLPENSSMIFMKKVDGLNRFCFSYLDDEETLNEIIVR